MWSRHADVRLADRVEDQRPRDRVDDHLANLKGVIYGKKL